MMGASRKFKCNAGHGGEKRVEEELRPQSLAALGAFLERNTSALQVARVLLADGSQGDRATPSTQGTTFFGYAGPHSLEKVAAWLESSW